MARVIHIGDIHLQHGHPRNADRLAALDQIVAYAQTSKVPIDAIVIPGDVWHIKPTTPDINAFEARASALANIADLVICYGNHDEPASLNIFGKTRTKHRITVVDVPCVVYAGVKADLAIFVWPWTYKAGLVTQGVAPDAIGTEARPHIETIFRSCAALIHDERGYLPLAIGHWQISGAIASTGQPQIGRPGIEIDQTLLDLLGPIYKGANHIHKHQTAGGAVYAGSICRMDFGENEDKGFLVVDIFPGGAFEWEFVPLRVPAQITIEGELVRKDGQWHFITESPVPDVTGADVRCLYHYKQAEAAALDLDLLQETFVGARSYKLEGIPELEHQIRAPEIVAAVTLEAKARAYCDRQGIAWSDGIAQKLQELQG